MYFHILLTEFFHNGSCVLIIVNAKLDLYVYIHGSRIKETLYNERGSHYFETIDAILLLLSALAMK